MKKVLAIGLLISVLGSVCAHGQWKDLFNGKNFKGWEQLDGTAEYYVEDGVMVGVSKMGIPNSFMATKKTYGDFILEYDMKMDRGLNSGVQFRSDKTLPGGKERVNGYQVECDDHADRPWVGGIYEEAGRMWLYPMSYNKKANKAFKPGEWNTFRVEAVGNIVRTYVNGVPFANMVDDKRPSGIIALQVHGIGKNEKAAGKKICWKNIRIMEEGLEEAMIKDADFGPEVSYLDNQLTEAEKAAGWKLLWDGKTKEGWRGAKLDRFPEGGWKIENGTLNVLKGDGGESTNGGDIVTVKKYKNFVLEVDFNISKGANSGIKYFVDTELNKGAGSSIGCEFQILDDKNHPDAKAGVAGNRTVGSCYDLITADALLFGDDNRSKRMYGTGKWNRARVVVKDGKVCHFLNGIKVVEYDRSTQMWKALVAYSKYKNWPAFGEAEEGHILLQDHGDAVSFRNVKIKELD